MRSEQQKKSNRESASAHYYANRELKLAYQRAFAAKRREDPVLHALDRKRATAAVKKSRAKLGQDPAWAANRNAKTREWNRVMKSTPEGWRHIILTSARARAKVRGIAFDILPEDISLPTHCPITGVELIYGCGVGRKDGPSLDRIRPELGYVRGNVRIISFLANSLKSDCTDPRIFRALAEDAERLFGG